MKYIFGPVPSRRLGLSLGLDIIPFKYCSLDCVYCECGKTTVKTLERKPYVPADAVINELKEFLKKDIKFNYITFSGSGEPTLNSDIGKMITQIREIVPADKKIAVLTNGTLLHLKEVREELKGADLVVPSLDAAIQNTFFKINRAPIELNIEKIIDGLITFRKEFKGDIWLEIFFLKDINDSPKDIEELIKAAAKIEPDKVQLNSIDRPPAEIWAKGLSKTEMETILSKFKKFGLPAEIITRFNSEQEEITKEVKDAEKLILDMIKRRPETLKGLSEALNMHINNLNKILSILENENKIETTIVNNNTFYKIKEK